MYKVKSIQAFVRKYGAKRSAVVVTLAVMGVSILVSFIICFGILGFRGREQLLVSFMLSVLVPAMISPVISYGFSRLIEMLDQSEQRNEELILELQKTLANLKTLKGLLPICSSCKKIRNDSGYWSQIEDYIGSHSEAEFTHGICPDCFKKLYPQYAGIQKQ